MTGCGRIDDHEPHEWTRPKLPHSPATTYHCPGAPTIEGGWAHWDAIDDAADEKLRAALQDWGTVA